MSCNCIGCNKKKIRRKPCKFCRSNVGVALDDLGKPIKDMEFNVIGKYGKVGTAKSDENGNIIMNSCFESGRSYTLVPADLDSSGYIADGGEGISVSIDSNCNITIGESKILENIRGSAININLFDQANDANITGTAAKGATVIAYNSSGDVIGSAVASRIDGRFAIPTASLDDNGAPVYLKQKYSNIDISDENTKIPLVHI